LTREEAKRDDGTLFGYDERSASAQRLAISTDRPSRADSKVTFALDTMEKEQPPIPPVRSRDHAKQEISLGNHTDRSIATEARDQVSISKTNLNNKTFLLVCTKSFLIFFETQQDIVKRERTVSPKPTAVTEDNSKLHTTSVTSKKERSLSPFSMPKIQGHQREENRIAADHYSLSNSSNSILKRQTVVVSESMAFSPSSPQEMPLEDDENALHGSSEFMLVLYPEDETREREIFDVMNGKKNRMKSSMSKHKQKFSTIASLSKSID